MIIVLFVAVGVGIYAWQAHSGQQAARLEARERLNDRLLRRVRALRD